MAESGRESLQRGRYCIFCSVRVAIVSEKNTTPRSRHGGIQNVTPRTPCIGRSFCDRPFRTRTILTRRLLHGQGDDTCALEVEISSAARAVAPASAGAPEAADESPSWENEDFDVPLALMTVGWDPSGDPTHTWSSSGRDVNCALRMLNLPRVVVWLTSHKQEGSHDHPKASYCSSRVLEWRC